MTRALVARKLGKAVWPLRCDQCCHTSCAMNTSFLTAQPGSSALPAVRTMQCHSIPGIYVFLALLCTSSFTASDKDII